MRNGESILASAALAAILGCIVAAPANAEVFDWTFLGSGLSGGGVLTATEDSTDPGAFNVTGITGSVNGAAISGLTSYDGADQVVYYPPRADSVVDTFGFSFGVGDGSLSFNIYEDGGRYTPGTYFACGAPYCILGPGLTDGWTLGADTVAPLAALTLRTIPEPSTWAMMLVGFAGAGLMATRGRPRARTA